MSRRSYLWVFLAGFFMPFLTGFLGLMPLDQSVIFEAGGRIARGALPYRDILFPYGLVPALMQAAIFKLGGISWFTYVLHAALVNGLFAVITADILKLLLPNGKNFLPVAGSLLSAWAFYPMTGTPFMDNHSLFFSMVAWWACLAAFRRKKHFLFVVCFAAFAAGFYSKPIPVIFWIFPVMAECLFHRTALKPALPWIAAGIAVSVALMLAPAIIFPAEQFLYYAFRLPFGIGRSRIGGSFISKFAASVKYFKVLLVCLIPFVLYLFLKDKKSNGAQQVARFIIIIAITVITGVLTKNSFYNFTSPVFIIAFVVFHQLLENHKAAVVVCRLYRQLAFVLWLALITGLTILNLRREIDIRFSFRDLDTFSEELGFFVKTPLGRHSKSDMEKLKGLISSNNAVYTGDSQFLFSLSGKENPLPITHLNDGTTYNSGDSVHYRKLRNKLVENMVKNKSNILIEDLNWNGDQDLVRYIQSFRGERIDSFGLITVYRLKLPGPTNDFAH